jgi:hypothetical protein
MPWLIRHAYQYLQGLALSALKSALHSDASIEALAIVVDVSGEHAKNDPYQASASPSGRPRKFEWNYFIQRYSVLLISEREATRCSCAQ